MFASDLMEVLLKNNKREEKFLLSGNNNIETGILFSI